METIVIKKFEKCGIWYSFESIPQEQNYIKIGCLRCGTDRKAINQAKRINPNFKYVVEVEK